MNFAKKFFYLFLLVLVGDFLFFKPAQAVVPPDFIFNIGSQIVQIFSVIAVFLSTVFVTVYQFVKMRLKNLKAGKLFWVGATLVVLVVAGLGATIYSLYKKNVWYSNWIKTEQIKAANAIVGQNNYFYDRIIVSGVDGQNKNFLLSFEAVRSQGAASSYTHGYNATILYDGKTYIGGDGFDSPSSSIKAGGLVTSYTWQSPSQLPTESGIVSLSVQGKAVSLELSGLNSDFLVKNKLNYFRYISSGKAHIVFDGQSFEGNVMVDKVLSNDKRVPTLGGYSPKRVSHSIALWDDEGRFYHFDLSEVFEKNDLYQSHQWILFKDILNGGVQKFYRSDLRFKTSKDGAMWNITVPEMDVANFVFETGQVLKNETGFISDVSGFVLKDNTRKKIRGYAIYEKI